MARYISFPFRFQRDTQHDGLRHDLTKTKIMIQHIIFQNIIHYPSTKTKAHLKVINVRRE